MIIERFGGNVWCVYIDVIENGGINLIEMVNMAKNYIYRMDHYTGFAPNVYYGICSLSGCKKPLPRNWNTS